MDDATATVTPTVTPRVDLVSALRSAHAALDAVSVLGEDGLPSGRASITGLDVDELAEVVRLAARLEGRTAG